MSAKRAEILGELGDFMAELWLILNLYVYIQGGANEVCPSLEKYQGVPAPP